MAVDPNYQLRNTMTIVDRMEIAVDRHILARKNGHIVGNISFKINIQRRYAPSNEHLTELMERYGAVGWKKIRFSFDKNDNVLYCIMKSSLEDADDEETKQKSS